MGLRWKVATEGRVRVCGIGRDNRQRVTFAVVGAQRCPALMVAFNSWRRSDCGNLRRHKPPVERGALPEQQ
jgi:hypothetical protein